MKRNTKIAKNIALALTIGFAGATLNVTPAQAKIDQEQGLIQNEVGEHVPFKNLALVENSGVGATTLGGLYIKADGQNGHPQDVDIVGEGARGVRASGATKIFVQAERNNNIEGYIYASDTSTIGIYAKTGDNNLAERKTIPDSHSRNVIGHIGTIGIGVSGDGRLSIKAEEGNNNLKGELLSIDNTNISILAPKGDNNIQKNMFVEGNSAQLVKATGDNTFNGVFANGTKDYNKANGNHEYVVSTWDQNPGKESAEGKLNITGKNNTFNQGVKTKYHDELGEYSIHLHTGSVMNVKADENNTVNGKVVVNASDTLNLKAENGKNNLTGDVFVASDKESMANITDHVKNNLPKDKQGAVLNLDATGGNTINNLTVGLEGGEFKSDVTVDSHDQKTTVTGKVTATNEHSTITFNTNNADDDANNIKDLTAAKGGKILVNGTAGGNTVNTINTDGGKVNLKAKTNTVTGNIKAVNGNHQDDEANTAENSDIVLNGTKNVLQGTVEAENSGFIYLGSTDANEVNADVTMKSKGKIVVNAKKSNTLTGKVSAEGGQAFIESTDGGNNFGELASTQAGLIDIKSFADNNINKKVTADGGTINFKTTGSQGKNILAKDVTMELANDGAINVTGRNGNELLGTVKNNGGKLTVEANVGNNLVAGTITTNGGTSKIQTDDPEGDNEVTGTISNVNGATTISSARDNLIKEGGKITAEGGKVTVTGKTNSVDATSTVESTKTGDITITGEKGNAIDGALKTANTGAITLHTGQNNTLSETATVTANGGTINLNADENNDLKATLTAKGGTINATSKNKNNVISGVVKAEEKGKINFNAKNGTNEFVAGADVSAKDPVSTITATAKNNIVKENAQISTTEHGTVSLLADETNTIEGTVVSHGGNLVIDGNKNEVKGTGTLAIDKDGEVQLTAKEANTIDGKVNAKVGTIKVHGKTNVVNNGAELTTDKNGTIELKADANNTVSGKITNTDGTVKITGATGNNIGGEITNTKGAMEITATTGKNELTGTITSAASLKVEATAGNNEFNGNLTVNDGKTTLNAAQGKNVFAANSETTAEGTGTITATAKNNEIAKDGKVVTKGNGTVNLLGTEGNTVDGTLESAGGTLTLDAKANNNTINGTVKATAGTINLDAKAGQNVFAGDSNTVASGEGHINATAKTNDLQKDSIVSSVGNGEVTITGEANTINGTVSSEGGVTKVKATKGNNTVGADATIEATGTGTTTIEAAKDNTVAAGATISTKDKGTVKFEAGANNTFNNDINTEGGTLDIKAQTGANTFNGTVETNKGTIDVKAEQDNTFAKDVTITDGTLKVKSNNGNNIFKGKVKGTNSTIDVEAKEDNTFEQDLAVELGNTHIKGKNNNFIGEVKADKTVDPDVVNIEANNKNTFEKLMTAQNDAKVIISARENEFKNGLTADNKGIITVKSDVTNISGPITATKGGVINLSYGQATINGDINSKDEGSQVNVSAVDGDTKAKTTIKGKSDAREGGTINLELTAGSVLDGSLNNHAGDDGVDKGTINLTMHGENIFTNGKDNPNQNDDKPSINATTGAVWNPGGDKGRVISSIDNLAGVGIINGQNADINVDKFVNTKDKGKENVSRIEFHTNLTKDDHGTITIGKTGDNSIDRHTTADLVKDKDKPRLTVVALDYKEAVKKAQNNEDLNLIIGGSTPGAYLDGFVDYADKNIKDTVFKDPLIVVWDDKTQQWKITLNSNAQQSNLGKLIYQIAPMATYGSMVSNLLNDTYNQRMGAALYDPSRASGPWARTYHDRFGQGDAYRSLVTGLQAGFRTVKNKEEAQVIHAVAVQADTHKLSFPGIDGSAKAHGTMLDYYYTKITKDGKYLDLNAKVGNINSKYQVEGKNGTVKGDYTLKVFSTGAEGGYTKNFGKDDKAYIQTQAQLQYTYLSKVNCHIESADVNMSHVNSLMGRAGFNVGMRTSDSTLAYVKANVLHEFMAKQNITVADNSTGGAGVTTSIRNRDTFYTIGLGVTHSMKDNSRVFADVEKVLGNNYKNSYRLNFGAQFMY